MMQTTLSLHIDECLDTPKPQWESWGNMLRMHPTMLRGILDIIPPATNTADALARIKGVHRWAKQCGMELCEIHTRESHDLVDGYLYQAGVSFGDSPYSTHPAPEGVGRHYMEPYLAQNPIREKFLENHSVEYYLRNENQEDEASKKWIDRLIEAERQWFSSAFDAPVIVASWYAGDDYATSQVHNYSATSKHRWDITDAMLAIPPLDRRRVDGFRANGGGPIRHPSIPEAILQRKDPCTFKIGFHMSSKALMTYRKAIALDQLTPTCEHTKSAIHRL